MARPRKDSGEADARTRLIEAFWDLLEREQISGIAVSSVTQLAGCNRGTFYYHFPSIEALVSAALEQEIKGDHVLADALWSMIAQGDTSALCSDPLRRHLHRLMLAMEAGAAREIDCIVRSSVLARWERLAGVDEGGLCPDACFAVQFMVSGVMSFAVAVGIAIEQGDASGQDGACPPVLPGPEACNYLRDVALKTADTVARVQDLDEDELLARVTAAMGDEHNL